MKKVSRRAEVAVAAGVAVFGLAFAFAGAAWVAGSLGISASVADQVVTAITTGGLAFTIASGIFSGGILSAISATVLHLITKKGKAVAVA